MMPLGRLFTSYRTSSHTLWEGCFEGGRYVKNLNISYDCACCLPCGVFVPVCLIPGVCCLFLCCWSLCCCMLLPMLPNSVSRSEGGILGLDKCTCAGLCKFQSVPVLLCDENAFN